TSLLYLSLHDALPIFRSGIGSDGFRDAIRERHDREVGIDLERIGEEARVGDEEPRDAVYAAPGVGDGVGRAPPHGAAAHQMGGRQRHGPRPEVSRGDALLDPAGLGSTCSRGNACMMALWDAPKPVRLFAVTNGKYMQVSSTNRSSAARSTK